MNDPYNLDEIVAGLDDGCTEIFEDLDFDVLRKTPDQLVEDEAKK